MQRSDRNPYFFKVNQPVAKYRFTVTYEIDVETQEEALHESSNILNTIAPRAPGGYVAEVSLTREGDRSAANLLSAVPGTKHYKHHKIGAVEAVANLKK